MGLEGIGEIAKAIGKQAGVAGNVLGGTFNLIGAYGQMKQAKKNQAASEAFNNAQLGELKNLYGGLMTDAKGQATYKGDTSLYEKSVLEANKQRQEAGSMVNPTDSLARENAMLNTSNLINAANKGAKSGTDLMSIAGAAANQQSREMRDINMQNASFSANNKLNANNTYLNSLSQLAGAAARERGLEFQSSNAKDNMLLGLQKEAGLSTMDMAYNNQQQSMAMAGAVQNAKSSMWSGVGDIFRSVGNGMQKSQDQTEQLGFYQKMYGTSKG